MKVTLLGEQSTGKSSYLVTLYGALQNDRIDGFRLANVLDDVGFLNRGLEALMRNERVTRTDTDAEAELAIELAGPDGSFTVQAPDRSGELLKNMINGRVWDRELLGSLDDLDGAILFLHPLRFDPGRSAEELDRLLEDGPAEPEVEPSGEDADPVPWKAALMPGDVRAIDLLQAIADRRTTPLRLALVLSAWDRVEDLQPGPRAWIQKRAPLLDQFLAANEHRFPHALFGVSAQGFDFKDPTSGSEEVRELDPWDRARAVDEAGDRTALIEPLLWLADQVPGTVDG